MKTIQELNEQRIRAWEAAKAFLDAHQDANGNLSAEDAATYEKMEKDITDLGTAIERQKRLENMEAALNRPTASPIVTTPGSTGTKTKKRGRASDEYKAAMLTALRTKFRAISDYLSEGVDGDGGYLVPEEWDSRLIDILDEENIMRKLGTKITTSGTHRINIAATKPAALWVEEGGELTWGDATFDQVLLDAHKLHVAVKVTEELLYDNAFDLEGYLLTQFGKSIANAEEDAFLNGDGDGKPTGLFTSATDSGISGVTSDNLIDLVYALRRPYRKSAKFIMADSVIATVRKLKDDNGAYIWQPSYQAGEPDRILGYEVYTSAYAPETSIAFGDYSYYNIGDRQTRSLQELRELFAGNGMVGYLSKERVDGILVLPEAVQVLTVSE